MSEFSKRGSALVGKLRDGRGKSMAVPISNARIYDVSQLATGGCVLSLSTGTSEGRFEATDAAAVAHVQQAFPHIDPARVKEMYTASVREEGSARVVHGHISMLREPIRMEYEGSAFEEWSGLVKAAFRDVHHWRSLYAQVVLEVEGVYVYRKEVRVKWRVSEIQLSKTPVSFEDATVGEISAADMAELEAFWESRLAEAEEGVRAEIEALQGRVRGLWGLMEEARGLLGEAKKETQLKRWNEALVRLGQHRIFYIGTS